MQKSILILIILIVVVAIGLGIYFYISYSSTSKAPNNNVAQNQEPTEFETQGVMVKILTKGSGVGAKNGDNVLVHYVGKLADGSQFDSSVDKNIPFPFLLGAGRVIKGWDIGVVGMKVGEKRMLTIPPELAYGANGFLTIPPNATLTFEVQMIKIN